MLERTVFDPTDKGTLRPNEAPIHKVGTGFTPLVVEDRPTEIHLPDGVSPLEPFSLFELYYSIEMIDSIVLATNRYQRKVGESKFARGSGWYDTNPREIYIYLAIRIYMTLHIENEIADYWDTSDAGPKHPITIHLSVNRFKELHIRYRLGEDVTTTYTRVRSPSFTCFVGLLKSLL